MRGCLLSMDFYRSLMELSDMFNREAVAKELVTVTRLLTGEVKPVGDLTGRDAERFRRFRKDFHQSLLARGFEYNQSWGAPYHIELQDREGPFTIDVGPVRFPDHSMTSNRSIFEVRFSVTEGTGRGGVLVDKDKAIARKLSGVPRMTNNILKSIDEFLK